jgi:hypothetical protein
LVGEWDVVGSGSDFQKGDQLTINDVVLEVTEIIPKYSDECMSIMGELSCAQNSNCAYDASLAVCNPKNVNVGKVKRVKVVSKSKTLNEDPRAIFRAKTKSGLLCELTTSIVVGENTKLQQIFNSAYVPTDAQTYAPPKGTVFSASGRHRILTYDRFVSMDTDSRQKLLSACIDAFLPRCESAAKPSSDTAATDADIPIFAPSPKSVVWWPAAVGGIVGLIVLGVLAALHRRGNLRFGHPKKDTLLYMIVLGLGVGGLYAVSN